MQSYQETLIFPLLFLLFLIFIISKWLSQNSTTKKYLPPSPPRLPIIGNLHQLGEYPWRSFRALSEKYGDVMLVHLGSKPTIIVSSLEMTSQVLKTHDAVFAGRPKLPVFKRLVGNDILASPYGEHWRRMKTIFLQDLLSKRKLEAFRKVREEEVDLMVKEIERLRFVNLSEMLKSFGVDLTCRMTFGRKYKKDDVIGFDLIKLVSEFVEVIGENYVGDVVSWLGWIDWIRGVKAKVNRVAKTLDVFIMGILEERLRGRNENGEVDHDNDGESVKDLVDVLLDVNSSKNYLLGKQDVKSLILDVFTAGPEIVYIVLEWMMSELVKNRKAMDELRNEILTIVGNKEAIAHEDLKNMNYLKAVFKETLRLHPPAPILFPHESTNDVAINGFHIAKGTQVLVNTWSVLRDPRYWKEPDRFHPQRFLDYDIDYKGQYFQYTPFGSGRRMCPGTDFVTSIVELVVANLVYRFDWALPDGKEREYLDMTEASGLLVHKKKPLIVIASSRP